MRNPFETDERYRTIADKNRVAQATELSLIEQASKDLETARREYGKCVIAAQGYESEFWKLLSDEFIRPRTSLRKILSMEGDKRIEAEGAANGLLLLQKFVEDGVRSLSRWHTKVEELEKKLIDLQNRGS